VTLLTFRPVRIATGSEDEDGCLVFNEDQLIAVLVRLSDLHGDAEGKWFLEAAFGHLDHTARPSFDTLDEAKSWIGSQIEA
jgi:hypothetical protein